MGMEAEDISEEDEQVDQDSSRPQRFSDDPYFKEQNKLAE
jgi:hypothetical protein